ESVEAKLLPDALFGSTPCAAGTLGAQHPIGRAFHAQRGEHISHQPVEVSVTPGGLSAGQLEILLGEIGNQAPRARLLLPAAGVCRQRANRPVGEVGAAVAGNGSLPSCLARAPAASAAWSNSSRAEAIAARSGSCRANKVVNCRAMAGIDPDRAVEE